MAVGEHLKGITEGGWAVCHRRSGYGDGPDGVSCDRRAFLISIIMPG